MSAPKSPPPHKRLRAGGVVAWAAAGAVLPVAPGQAHEVPPATAELQARVAAVRAALEVLPPAAIGEAAAAVPDWTNWPKWSKWSNWANK